MKALPRLLLSFLAPGVVLLLLGVQIAFGIRGFDNPRGGGATMLEVPGLLVGWGALAFLIPLLIWLVLDWWGVSASGLALKCLGAAVLALAVGATTAVAGGVAAGGHVGAALADLLSGTLGSTAAVLLLVLMGVPGLILASAGFRGVPVSRKKEASERTEAAAVKKKRGGVFGLRRRRKVTNLADLVRDDVDRPTRERGEAWYPEPLYDEQGVELPMQFDGSRDVGGIRYAEPEAEPEPEAERAATAEAPQAQPTDEPADEPALDSDDTEENPDDRVHVEDPDTTRRRRLAQGAARSRGTGAAPVHDAVLSAGVRWVDPEPEAEAEAEAEPELEPEADEEAEDGGEEYEYVYVDEDGNPIEGEVDEAMLSDDDDVEYEYVEVEVEDEDEDDEPAAPDTPSVKDSVQQALDGEAQSKSSRRYLEKLEASGIFDFMREDPPPAKAPSKQAPSKQAAPAEAAPKKAASKKAASKKAAPKKAAPKKPRPKQAAPKQGRARKQDAGTASAPKRKRPDAPTQVVDAPAAKPERGGGKAGTPKQPARTWRTGPWRGGPQASALAPDLDPEVENRRAARERLLARERLEPGFARAATIAVERGSVSAVLLTRRMGIGFADAKGLITRLVAVGLLGEATRSGAYPAQMTADDWLRG